MADDIAKINKKEYTDLLFEIIKREDIEITPITKEQNPINIIINSMIMTKITSPELEMSGINVKDKIEDANKNINTYDVLQLVNFTEWKKQKMTIMIDIVSTYEVFVKIENNNPKKIPAYPNIRPDIIIKRASKNKILITQKNIVHSFSS